MMRKRHGSSTSGPTGPGTRPPSPVTPLAVGAGEGAPAEGGGGLPDGPAGRLRTAPLSHERKSHGREGKTNVHDTRLVRGAQERLEGHHRRGGALLADHRGDRAR